MRWYAEDMHTAWPDTFHTGCATSAACEGNVTDLIFRPAALYLALWTVPYSLFIFVYMDSTIKANDYVTMFSSYRDKIFRNKEGKFWIEGERQQQVVYMSMHAALSFSTFGIAYLCWHHFWFHTIYLILQLQISLWNGAKYYFEVAMNKERLLKKALEEKAKKESSASEIDSVNNKLQ